jgi:hypothetical protein
MPSDNDAWSPATTNNKDIFSLVSKYDRIVFEAMGADSGVIMSTLSPDIARMQRWTDEIRAQTVRIFDKGPPDLPHMSPRFTYVFKTQGMDIDSIENIDLRALAIEYTVAWVHWSRAESSSMHGWFLKPDYDRAIAILDTIDSMLAALDAAADTPQDFPQSAKYQDPSPTPPAS